MNIKVIPATQVSPSWRTLQEKAAQMSPAGVINGSCCNCTGRCAVLQASAIGRGSLPGRQPCPTASPDQANRPTFSSTALRTDPLVTNECATSIS